MLSAALALHSFLLFQAPPASCASVAECKQAAIDAAARHDFEAFHDLAWRTAQKARPNDPELMYLLARAQSLSGRPGDALVMLRRLAQLGVATDAATNDDFRRVRALAGWAELEALIAATPASAAVPSTPAPAELNSSGTDAARAKTASAPPAAVAKPSAAAADDGEVTPRDASTGTGEAMRLSSVVIEPVGLAYDSASKRFVLGDRRDNKLIVADEVFNHVNDLIGATSGGFGRLSAVEIDTRRGDLWVSSSDANGAAAIHKLQLVSGRVLARLDMPASLQPIAIGDFAVLDSGALMVLDSARGRLLLVKGPAGRFDPPIDLHLTGATSIAPAGSQVYVAHQAGLSVVDMATGRVTAIGSPKETSLRGLRRIRWNRGMLLALQGEGDDAARVIRIRLSRRGHSASVIEPLDRDGESAGSALTIAQGAAYYVAQTPAGSTIRRIKLR